MHDEPQPTNSITSRTQSAVAMGPSIIMQGLYKFFALSLRKKSMPQPIVDQVNQIRKEEHDMEGITFSTKINNILEDEINDLEFNLEQKLVTDMNQEASAEFPGVDIESNMQLDFMPTHQEGTPEFAAEEDLNDLVAESAQNADDIDMTRNIRIMSEKY